MMVVYLPSTYDDDWSVPTYDDGSVPSPTFDDDGNVPTYDNDRSVPQGYIFWRAIKIFPPHPPKVIPCFCGLLLRPP